jgi:hypothetical protein
MDVLIIGNTEPYVSNAKYLLEHAYGMLLVLPLVALLILLLVTFAPLSVVPAEEPYIVATFLSCPSAIPSKK